jgi:Flp pilus assembly protein TadD
MIPLGRRSALWGGLLFSGLVVGACVETETISISGAETLLEAPAAVEPRPSGTYLSLGKRLLAHREPDLAIRAFLISLNNEGLSAQAMTGAGIAYQQQGLLTVARSYLEQARQLAPNSVVVHNNLGVVLYQLKEYYPARDEFRSAFAISNGTSEMAERNLNRVEATIAASEMVPETDQAISHEVIRLGGGEFRLVKSATPETDAMTE